MEVDQSNLHQEDNSNNNNNNNNNIQIQIGPDLNSTKSKLDKKEYRQILLPNGLRVILISDTIAIQHHQDDYLYDDESGNDEDESKKNDENDGIENDNMDVDDDDDDDDEKEDDDDDDDDDDDGLRKAAAAIIIGAGSFHDPPYAQGLAHYLEHMLFMGSTKYPIENQYDSFLSKHSGSDNAYTECEHTVYYLEVCQEKIFESMDMLAWFFREPLMKNDAVERELKSIESEFQLSKNSDECRMQQLFCHESMMIATANSSSNSSSSSSINATRRHPFSNFSWGNIQSLQDIPQRNNIDMMKELRKFFDCHYYAQNMSLVVVGGYSLDKLQKHVIESFSAIPALPRLNCNNNNNDDADVDDDNNHTNDELYYHSMSMKRTSSNDLDNNHMSNDGKWYQKVQTPIQKFGMPFHKQILGRVCRIVPVKDKHNLCITWQIPPQFSNWKSKPVDYIAHLLGHEGKGSLLSCLKEKSFVNECYAGVGTGGYENASSHALFCMTFTLTENGVDHWVEIVHHVYMYIGMLRYYCNTDDGLPEWIFEELKAIQDLSYQYADEEQPIDLVETIVDSLIPYNTLPPERLLDGDSLLFKFDGDAIKDLLDKYMHPTNARIDILSSTFGRASDFEEELIKNEGGMQSSDHDDNIDLNNNIAVDFSPAAAGKPLVEPHFGTRYWTHCIPIDIIEQWARVAEPQLPSQSKLSLPPLNPFVPTNFALKALPLDDSHHPLLFCSLKLCITVGKKKAWFPCTVNKYDRIKNRVLLVYEDEDEKWHKVDVQLEDFHKDTIMPNAEGTLDGKSIKYKIVSVPRDGDGAVLKYGDESDWHVEDGMAYPHVPPAQPASRLPKLVSNTKLLKFWHLQDRKFKRPFAELRMLLTCQFANKTPLHRACAELLAILIHDTTTETCYLASVCELGNSIRATDLGLSIRVHGFDHKLLDLTSEILKVLFSFNSGDEFLPAGIIADRFYACLDILRRKYNNEGMRASSLCSDIRLRCLRPTIWSANDKASAIKDLTVATFMKTISTLLGALSIEALFLGNVDTNDADTAIKLISQSASSSTGIGKNKYPKQEVLVVTPTKEVHPIVVPTIDPKEPNTAIEMYIQCGKDNLEERVIIDLLVQIMYEPLFDQLRTKEQLGYQVSCGTRWTFGVMGISFKVVTTCKSADDVSVRIDEFLKSFREELVSMSKETYMEHVVGLAKNKLEKCNSLEEEAGNLWYEIVESRYDWEVHRNEAHALRSISKEQVLKAFDDWLYPSTTSHRKLLVVHAIGTKEGVSSMNRPTIPPEDVCNAIDDKVKAFHKASANKTWGKILM